MSDSIAQGGAIPGSIGPGVLTAKIDAKTLLGSIGAGSVIVNDYVITLTEIPGGLNLTVKRGSEVQSMDVMGADEDAIAQLVEDYLTKNPPSGGTVFRPDGETLLLENGVLRVNTADIAEEDNTRPITSAAVATQVGNIEALLKTI